MKTLINILNAPITIWLLSSVVIGLMTWAYKSSSAKRSEKRHTNALIDKSEEELYLISEELILVASDKESLGTKRVQYLIERMQYLPFDLAKNEYRPTLYNNLLQLQSYTGSSELKKYRKDILGLLRKLIKLRDRHQSFAGEAQPLLLTENETDTIKEAIEFYKEISRRFSQVMK